MWVGQRLSPHNDTTRCWPQHPLEPKVPVTLQQSRSHSKYEYIKSHGDLLLSLSLYLQMHFISLFPLRKSIYPPVFPLLLCLATCGTQPLQYPAVHQTKSGMRNILRLPANSYENMLRPNLKQFAMANNTHWLTDPCRAQQAEHSTARARACS